MAKEVKKKKPRKKVVRKPAASVQTPVEKIDDMPEPLQMKQDERNQLELHETRSQLQTAIIEKTKFQIDLLGIKYAQEKAVLTGIIRQADNSRTEARDDYNTVVARIEQRMGIKLSEYIVADNGVLTHEADVG